MTSMTTTSELLRARVFDTGYVDFDDYPDMPDAPEFYDAEDEDEDQEIFRLPDVEEFGDWEAGPSDW